MQTKKKKGYAVLLGLTVLFTILAVITVLPNSGASKPCLLGYNSVCSFVPVAPLILLLCAGFFCVIRKKLFT
jgi:hypothetical protein